MLHIFWSCRNLLDFWSKVQDIIKQLTEPNLGSYPVRYLLHLSDFSKRKYRNSLVAHLLNAAKACIPALWKRETPPLILLWFKKIADIYVMEKGIAITQGKEEKFNLKWKPWSHFVCTREYGCALVEGELAGEGGERT